MLENEFADDYPQGDGSSYQEHQRTPYSEKVHWLLAELLEEPQAHKVQVPVYKTVEAEFALSEFALVVLDFLLANFGKQWLTLFWGAPKSLQLVTAAMKLKDTYSLEGKL